MPKNRKPEQSSSALSRRDFFKGSTLGAVSTALAGQEGLMAESEAGTQILGPGEVPIQLNVNGTLRRLEVEPRVTLLDALRNRLDLPGTKKVCDRATCGACTVLLDGSPVYACSILAIEAQGKAITTIEGLGDLDHLHPIQQAFVDNDGQQCGFCTPGFVVSCKAFLDKYPNPSMDDIKRELGGNLCRCGTYMGIRDAVMQAAGKGGSNA